MSADPRIKHIKIQTGVVKRIIKETSMYAKEFTQIENRIEKMKSEGKDEYDIRKMNEVLAESKMMGPDCIKRLTAACEDLKQKLADSDDLNQTPEFTEGLNQLKEADVIIHSH